MVLFFDLNTFMNYKLIHDNGKDICLVGKTSFNEELLWYIKKIRSSIVITLEEFTEMPLSKLNQFQFFILSGSILFKKQVVSHIKDKLPDAHFVSLVHESAVCDDSVELGYGVYVAPYVYVAPKTQIKNYVHIEKYSSFPHLGNQLEEYCFLGPYVSISKYFLKEGTWVGAYSKLNFVETQPYQQFISASRVYHHKFEITGTYRHTKLMDSKNSLEKNLS